MAYIHVRQPGYKWDNVLRGVPLYKMNGAGGGNSVVCFRLVVNELCGIFAVVLATHLKEWCLVIDAVCHPFWTVTKTRV